MRCAPTCTVASDSHTSSSGSSLTPPQLTPRNPLAGRGNKRGTQGTRSGRSGSGAAYATGSFETLPVAEESARAELVSGPTEPTDRASQHRDQPIDRDHQNVLLKSLDAACANQADHWHRAASTPPPTPAGQPRRLLAHPSEMAIVVCPRFRLDREPDAGRRDRQRVDVPSSSPRQRVPQPPPLRLKRRKHTRTSSSERAPTRLRSASDSQCRA